MMLLGLFVACQADERPEATEYGYPSEYGGYYVKFETTPADIPLNEEFQVSIHTYAAEEPTTILTDVTIQIDAQMPEHNHGMNQMPLVTTTDEGTIAEGMLFHMTGYWEVMVLIQQENKRETAYIPVDCCL